MIVEDEALAHLLPYPELAHLLVPTVLTIAVLVPSAFSMLTSRATMEEIEEGAAEMEENSLAEMIAGGEDERPDRAA